MFFERVTDGVIRKSRFLSCPRHRHIATGDYTLPIGWRFRMLHVTKNLVTMRFM